MRTSTKLIGVAVACVACCAAFLAITAAGAAIDAAAWPWGVVLAVVVVPLGTLAILISPTGSVQGQTALVRSRATKAIPSAAAELWPAAPTDCTSASRGHRVSV
jgi:ABC-type transport system involved in cytochrome c biogenesis permease component